MTLSKGEKKSISYLILKRSDGKAIEIERGKKKKTRLDDSLLDNSVVHDRTLHDMTIHDMTCSA